MILATTAKELNAHTELFVQSDASASPNDDQPYVIVIDDFYPDPDLVRKMAVSADFVQYEPPEQYQITDDTFKRFSNIRPGWFSSALLTFHGQKVRQPFSGTRHSSPEVLDLMECKLNEAVAWYGKKEVVNRDTWDTLGDWWNGAFHFLTSARGPGHRAAVHHHYKQGDVEPRGWSGVVYLHPTPPENTGTLIMRAKKTGKCVAPYGTFFSYDVQDYDIALKVENQYNRLVLLRECVLHQAGFGFGFSASDARLFQTFFFVSESKSLP